MKTLPPVLIVTDRGRLIAYRYEEEDRPRAIATAEFEEGNRKLSELVTDQAGAFPNTGSIGTSAAERMPLEAELEVRCFRKISETIREILAQEKVTRWGLAAPSEIHGAVVDFLSGEDIATLALQVKRDLVNSPAEDVVRAFEKASAPAWAG
ncbi:host attachment protein [Luteolibacter sp. Populi]|uniref:host attachment protein n=1 Tax=Luteolibacter sp. Populi TaxID=3230487 RepID=UPI0034679DDD